MSVCCNYAKKKEKMATDVEESDTDEHERPTPPKRPCMQFVNNDNTLFLSELESLRETLREVDDSEQDETERRATEKLKKWQACQMAKGFIDNTINCFLENYVLSRSYPDDIQNSPMHVFREYNEEMEDAAVRMAIHNHGLVCPLVQPTNLASYPNAFYNGSGYNGSWTSDEYPDVSSIYPFYPNEDGNNFAAAAAAPVMSAGILKSAKAEEMGPSNGGFDESRIDDSDQQQDFLERAVAEAIKKKGLSALSVDYG